MNIIVVDKRKYARSSETNGILYFKGLYIIFIYYILHISYRLHCMYIYVYMYVCVYIDIDIDIDISD